MLTRFLHAMSDSIDVPGTLVGAVALSALLLWLLWRRPGLAALVLFIPGALGLALALDLERIWPVPSLMERVSFTAVHTYRFEVDNAGPLVWDRRVCAGLRLMGPVAYKEKRVAAEFKLSCFDHAGNLLAEHRVRKGDWEEEYAMGGGGGIVCLVPPEAFTVELDVLSPDPRLENADARVVVAVPRDHIVPPEKARGLALAGAIPLLLGAAAGILIADSRNPKRLFRRRRDDDDPPDDDPPEDDPPEDDHERSPDPEA